MKRINFSFSAVLVAMACASLLNSCADHDVYDPTKEKPVPPAENPLGDDFTAPDGFEWSMTNTVDINVAVKDEFNGKYHYLIEVFTTNPLANSAASPIAAGLAKGGENYTDKITIPQTCERVFIRQTDPKQRKEIYEFETPENGSPLNCKLYFENTTTRAAGNSTSAFEAAQAAGITELEDKRDEDENVFPPVPSTSDDFVQYNPGQLREGSNFVIGTEYTENNPFTTLLSVYKNQGRVSIYVQGTWKLENNGAGLNSNLDIYILQGGKLIADNLTIGKDNTLAIQAGGGIECTTLNLKSPTKNFGSIIAQESIRMDEGKELFNGGEGSIEAAKIEINGIDVINHFSLKAASFNFINSRILNKSYIEGATDINNTSTEIFNYGDIQFTGNLTTNDNLGALFINHVKATITGNSWIGGASIYNDGLIEVSICKNNSNDALYNSCTMIVKESFKFRHVTLNKGSITGGRISETSKEWLPIPYVESQTDSKFTFIDGSMIKAKEFVVLSGDVHFKATNSANNDKSMLKAETISYNWNTYLEGNLVLEVGKESYSGDNSDCVKRESSVVSTGYDESKYMIETCGGILNEGNEGEDESEPKFPIEIGSGAVYTFAFEDQWPAYGDFDMNDAVITIDNISSNLKVENGSTYQEGIQIKGRIHAVGASNKLGVAIHFPNLPTQITSVSGKLKGENANWTIEDASDPTIVITNDIHLLMGNDADNRSFINTIAANTPSVEFEINLATGHIDAGIDINKIDLFIFKNVLADGRRTEVHLPGFAPTKLGNTAQFGKGNDASNAASQKYYVSVHNLAWGICIPGNTTWAWPKETANIKATYSLFEGWVKSGGKQNTDWMNTHNDNVITVQ